MNVLGIGAHYDDLELGCSGSLINHVNKGDKVTMLVVTDSSYKDYNGSLIRAADVAHKEGLEAAKIIGAELVCLRYKTFEVPFNEELTRKIIHQIEERKVDIIYSHWIYDLHRDHQFAAKCALMAGRHVPRFLMYQSNYYDTEQQFHGNFYSDISEVMNKKIEVIKTNKSELERVKYEWLDFFKKQNKNDGQRIGVEYAERFEAVRYFI